MKIGFVGTGTMGNPMASRLIRAGHQLRVHDLRREAAANLLELGAVWAESPRAAAEWSEAVLTSLPGPSEVEKVALGPASGLLAGLSPGSLYIDMTTNSPTLFARIAEACQAKGVEVLDAPVSGGSAASEEGTLTFMVGGASETFAKARPLLECLGTNIFHVGRSGSGCIAKLVTQYMGYTNFIAAAEGLLIAAKAGIDLRVLAEIVPVSAGGSRLFDTFPRTIFSGEFAAPGTLDIVAKDLSLACQLAREVAAPAFLGEFVEDVLQRGRARGWGQRGFPIVVRVMEELAGVELRAPAAPTS